MKDKYQKIISVLGGNRVKIGEMLGKYTSLKIGGPADLFMKVQTTDDLVWTINTARENGVDYFILGSGTNILFSDLGYRGLVIKNETGNVRLRGMTGKRIQESDNKNLVNKVILEVDSGVTINRLVRNTVDQGLSGLEYFLGQPGTVGGAMWINAHNVNSNKYFGELVLAANIYKPGKGTMDVSQNYFNFSYDKSVIQKTGDIVLSVTLELNTGNKDLLWQTAKSALLYRQKTQPSGIFSAGCLFRNIDRSEALRIRTPEYTCSAGFLIDSVGLKGFAVGGAKFSENHANFLINTGNATSADVLELINLAKKKVYQKYAVKLNLEVVIAGREKE